MGIENESSFASMIVLLWKIRMVGRGKVT